MPVEGILVKYYTENTNFVKANRGKQVESQQIDTTRRLYCVQYLLQLSRLQRILVKELHEMKKGILQELFIHNEDLKQIAFVLVGFPA